MVFKSIRWALLARKSGARRKRDRPFPVRLREGKVRGRCLGPPESKKAALRRPYPQDPRSVLANDQCIRTGYRHQLAGLNDMSGLGVIRAAPGGDAETSHRNTGDERDNHDFQVGRTVRGVNGVVHLGLLAPLAPRVGGRLTPDLFQGGFGGSAKWFRRARAGGGAHPAIPPVAVSLPPRFTAVGR